MVTVRLLRHRRLKINVLLVLSFMLKSLSVLASCVCTVALLTAPLVVVAAPVSSGNGDIRGEEALMQPERTLAESRQASETLIRKLEKIRTVSARFQQEAVGSDGRTRTESGVMQMKRPGQFRWNTESPFEQEIVAIDSKVWLVDRDLMQVIIQYQDDRMGNTPAQLLSGDAREFLQDYRVFKFDRSEQEKFTLMPKENSDLFDKLDIIFRDDTLDAIELRDSLGGRRRVTFSKVNINDMISDSDFKVDIPKGYDVIDQTRTSK